MEEEIGDEPEKINSKIMERLMGQTIKFGFYPEDCELH